MVRYITNFAPKKKLNILTNFGTNIQSDIFGDFLNIKKQEMIREILFRSRKYSCVNGRVCKSNYQDIFAPFFYQSSTIQQLTFTKIHPTSHFFFSLLRSQYCDIFSDFPKCTFLESLAKRKKKLIQIMFSVIIRLSNRII